MNLLIETKDKANYTLSEEEQRKIKHAELLFQNVRDDVDVVLKLNLKVKKSLKLLKMLLVKRLVKVRLKAILMLA